MDFQVISSQFYFDCASAVSLTLHFIHNQFSHLQNCLPFIYLIQKPTNGAPTLHQFSTQLAPSQAKPYCTGAPIFVSVHSSHIIIYLFGNCKNTFFQHLHSFFLSPLATFFFWKSNPCRSWFGNSLYYTHVDIIHKPRVPHIPCTPDL
jgi:hypothetical protein